MSEPIPLEIPPGIIKSQSENTVGAAFTDCDKVRFYDRKAEKIGGWAKLIPDQFESYARGATNFRDVYGNQHVCFGTAERLYVVRASQELENVTPFEKAGTLTNPFSAVFGSKIVTINHANHGLVQVGDVVVFSDATAGSGITIDGEYEVYNVIDIDTYQIVHSTEASSTVSGFGGTVSYGYEIAKGETDAALANGFGVGGYGEEEYGTPRVSASVQLEPRTWFPSRYGNSVLTCYNGSPLYHLVYTDEARAQKVSNSPKMLALVVTAERYIFALGADPIGGDTIDPMLVRWPDVDDYTDWTPVSTNTANARRLQSGSELIAGAALSAYVTLVWSDTSLYVFQFTGSSFVYDSRLAGENCGLAGPHATCVVDDTAYWMSPRGFHFYNGQVNEIPGSENIRKFVVEAFNSLQLKKSFCAYFGQFREIWWVYPSLTKEPDRYVSVNVDTFVWAIGTIDRTAFCIHRSEEAAPLMFGTNSHIYLHEAGEKDDDGLPMNAWIETGIMKMGNGRDTMHVQGFIPDMDRQTGDLELTLSARDHPKGTEIDTQTVTIGELDEISDLRVSGRHVSFHLSSNELGGDFRMGTNSVEVKLGGRARGR